MSAEAAATVLPEIALEKLWIGPAGWSYDDWKGRVYPAGAGRKFDPLEYIARYFDVVEINTSFYQPPPRAWTRAWVRRVEHNPRFRFTAKLWRRFTHERGTPPTRDEIAQFKDGIDAIAEEGRLLALLVQFPWSFRNGPEEREWVEKVAKTFDDYPLVLEVRHASWDDPETLAWLCERRIAFATIDQPQFDESLDTTERRTAPLVYYRLHGRNYANWWAENVESHERYDYLYPPEELRPWADRIREAVEDPTVLAVVAITNNHYQGQAAVNALQLKSWSTGRHVPVPEPLRESFPDMIEPIAAAPDEPASEPQSQTELFEDRT
jgi:uncharacterized protein YecE (DUF72 family)